jgi:hypothetical protein
VVVVRIVPLHLGWAMDSEASFPGVLADLVPGVCFRLGRAVVVLVGQPERLETE